LNTDYKDYALYTIENRAIPSVIDGLKPVQRKILACSIKLWKGVPGEKTKKIFQLAGSTAADFKYHHGDASLQDAIVGMAQTFKNNLPLFDREGQFGSLRSTEAGAPRYIGVKLNQNFSKLFKDKNLLTIKKEDDDYIEPKYFLPIIPMVLLNGTKGIAVGFATSISNRDPKEVTQACIDVLDGKEIGRLKPKIEEFSGTFELDLTEKGNGRRWIAKGLYELVNSTTVKITELAPSITYEKYKKMLDALVADKTIVSYEDKCSANIHYVIKFTKENLAKLIEKNKLTSVLGLEETISDNINTLDENGELLYFDNEVDVIKYFVNFRLSYYVKRKSVTLSDLLNDMKIEGSKYKFVKSVVDEVIEIRNIKKPDLIAFFDSQKYYNQDGYDYLLRMPIHSLTEETIEKLKEEIKKLKAEYDYIEKKTPEDMYREDLQNLLKEL
jgi:DNA topoisomerase-2